MSHRVRTFEPVCLVSVLVGSLIFDCRRAATERVTPTINEPRRGAVACDRAAADQGNSVSTDGKSDSDGSFSFAWARATSIRGRFNVQDVRNTKENPC